MPSARSKLRQTVHRLQPAAVAYIDWDTFEDEMDAAMSVTDVSKEKVLRVFAHAVTRARKSYESAVRLGEAWGETQH